MALSGSALTPIMIGQCASKGLLGSQIPSFCSAMSEGIVEGFVLQNKVITIDVGILPAGSPGTGVGKMTGLLTPSMLGVTLPLLASEIFFGTKSKDFSEAIINAIVIYFNTANIASTSHPLVAIGTGVGKVTSLSASALTAIVMAKMLSKNIKGIKLRGLVKAICTGFTIHVLATAVVTQIITGTPLLILGVPVPSAGAGVGNIT